MRTHPSTAFLGDRMHPRGRAQMHFISQANELLYQPLKLIQTPHPLRCDAETFARP